MSDFTFKFIFLLSVFCFMSCNTDNLIEEEEIITESRFEKFIGEWRLESTIDQGRIFTPKAVTTMIIEDDDNRLDRYAVGYYTQGEFATESMFIELGEVHNHIILKREPFIFDCTFTFLDENTLELDDSTEDSEYIDIWVRKE